MSVYVASSWRNTRQPEVVERLVAAGLDVYDFRHPAPGDDGFSWKDVGGRGALAAGLTPKGGDLVPVDTYLEMIAHPRAEDGFRSDMRALAGATTTVLILPCGRSAHLELGFAVGAGQRTAILLEDPAELELMYKMVGLLTADLDELVEWTATREADSSWRCPRCSSPAWVSAAIGGPVSFGGIGGRQCVPCGEFTPGDRS